MFKAAANKDASSSALPVNTATSGSMSSKSGKLRVTPEGGLSLVGDVGVLGRSNASNSQQGEKQKFFATRSADGKWNLLMAPTSDPSRLFLVQPAPGHKFQVAGGGIRMESITTASQSTSKESAAAANGCVEEHSPESELSSSARGDMPGTSKTIAVPVAQLRSSSSISSVSFPHLDTVVTPTNFVTAASTLDTEDTFNPQDHKKPSFFKSRTARDREMLKVSAQHMIGKKVLAVPRKSNKPTGTTLADSHGKRKKTASAKTTELHGKLAKIPSSSQEAISHPNSLLSVCPTETCSTTASVTTVSTSIITTSVNCTDMSSTVPLSVASSTSNSSTSSASCSTQMSSIHHGNISSPASSDQQHQPLDNVPPSNPHCRHHKVSSPSSIPLSPSESTERTTVCIAEGIDCDNSKSEPTVSRGENNLSLSHEGDSEMCSDRDLNVNSSVITLGQPQTVAEDSSVKRSRDTLKTVKKRKKNVSCKDVNLLDRSLTSSPKNSLSAGSNVESVQSGSRLSQTDDSDCVYVKRAESKQSSEPTKLGRKKKKKMISGKKQSITNQTQATPQNNNRSTIELLNAEEMFPHPNASRSHNGVAAVNAEPVDSLESGALIEPQQSSALRLSQQQNVLGGSEAGSGSDTDDYDPVIIEKQAYQKRPRKSSSQEETPKCSGDPKINTASVAECVRSGGDARTSHLFPQDQTDIKNKQLKSTEAAESFGSDVVVDSMKLLSQQNKTADRNQSDKNAVNDRKTVSDDCQLSAAVEWKTKACQADEADIVLCKESSTCKIKCANDQPKNNMKSKSIFSAEESPEPHLALKSRKKSTKARKKRKSELESLVGPLETSRTEESASKEIPVKESKLSDLTVVEESQTQKQIPGNSEPAEPAVISEWTEHEAISLVKKGKKKELKIVFDSGDVASGDKTDQARENSDILPSIASHSLLEKAKVSSHTDFEQAAHNVQSEGVRTVIQLGKRKKRRKWKNRKLKVILVDKQESSTRNTQTAASSASSQRKEGENKTDTAHSLVDQEKSIDNTSHKDQTAEFSSKKAFKKARKKRLTELEKIIHDQGFHSRTESTPEDSRFVSDTSEKGPESKADSEVSKTKEPEISNVAPEKNFDHAAENSSLRSSVGKTNQPAKKNSNQPTGTVIGIVDKMKKKRRKVRKVSEVAVGTSDIDTDATESVTDMGDVMVQDATPPLSEDTDSAYSIECNSDNSDEHEDSETEVNKATARFLKSRSFSESEFVQMFGAAYVVLERLNDKDIFFMSRRFRNARVSSRARCSAHCRQRTLGYLCELKLIDCKPSRGVKRTVSREDSNLPPSDSESVKKRKLSRDGKEKENKETKKKKLKKKDTVNERAAAGVTLPDFTAIEPSGCPSTAVLYQSTPNFSGYSASLGRVLRLAPAPARPSYLVTSINQATSATGPHFITIPSLPTGIASSLPQVITIPSSSASSTVASRIIIPPLLSSSAAVTTTSSLREATRASLAQAISNSLKAAQTTLGPASSAATTNAGVNSALISALSGSVSSSSKGSNPIRTLAGSATATPIQCSGPIPKQFFVVQMGDKRVLVPASALTSTATTTVATNVVSSSASTATTTSGSLSHQTLVNSNNVQNSLVSTPTIISSTGLRLATNPTSLVPGSVARIVLSNRHNAPVLIPRAAATASSLLFANRPRGSQPNQVWAGPRTVDSNKRVMVTPTSQPQGIRVVLSGAGNITPGSRFTVASSRGGVFVTSKQPTSLIRMPSNSNVIRPGKRVMTEEERLRKRARLEKKYPLPPGVTIKTEPVTPGYGDEDKTVQANTTATRVYVSSVPVGTSSRSQVDLSQPIPVISAMQNGPIIIRQAATSTATQRPSSLLGPLIIRVPNSSTSSATRIAAVPASTKTTSLLTSPARLATTANLSTPVTVSLVNFERTLTTAANTSSTFSTPLVTSSALSVPETSSAAPVIITSATSTPTVTDCGSVVGSSNSVVGNDDDDAIYIVDSPLSGRELPEKEVTPESDLREKEITLERDLREKENTPAITPERGLPEKEVTPESDLREKEITLERDLREKENTPAITPERDLPEQEVTPESDLREKEVTPESDLPEKEITQQRVIPEKEVTQQSDLGEKEITQERVIPEKEVTQQSDLPEKEITQERVIPEKEVTQQSDLVEKEITQERDLLETEIEQERDLHEKESENLGSAHVSDLSEKESANSLTSHLDTSSAVHPTSPETQETVSSFPTTSASPQLMTASVASPSHVTSSPSSPMPSTSTAVTSSRLASLGALWVRQVAESSDSVPSIDTSSLQSERMRRLKETLAKQIGKVGDERRQKALQALHKQFCHMMPGGGATSETDNHECPAPGNADPLGVSGQPNKGVPEMSGTKNGGDYEASSNIDGKRSSSFSVASDGKGDKDTAESGQQESEVIVFTESESDSMSRTVEEGDESDSPDGTKNTSKNVPATDNQSNIVIEKDKMGENQSESVGMTTSTSERDSVNQSVAKDHEMTKSALDSEANEVTDRESAKERNETGSLEGDDVIFIADTTDSTGGIESNNEDTRAGDNRGSKESKQTNREECVEIIDSDDEK